MISFNDQTVENSYDVLLAYFDPRIKSMTSRFLGTSPEKEDCRQELRIRLLSMHNNQEVVFSPRLVIQRFKWDIINFINRDLGYVAQGKMKSFDALSNEDVAQVNRYIEARAEEEFARSSDAALLKELIEKGKTRMDDAQYEAFVIYLSGAPGEILKRFFGSRRYVTTLYYVHLAAAFEIIREIANGDRTKG